jgi:hypothetical protein
LRARNVKKRAVRVENPAKSAWKKALMGQLNEDSAYLAEG